MFGPSLLPAASAPNKERFRGSRVQWARIVGGAHWNRHPDADQSFLNFLRANTSLDISPAWATVHPDRLDELCRHPILFCTGLYSLNQTERRNLAEYLRRGGFLLIDACANSHINPSLPAFRNNHVKILKSEIPDLEVAALPSDHPIFSIYFDIQERPPQARQTTAEVHYPLYALYSGERLLGIVSINALQCGWAGFSRVALTPDFMQMATNIYVYAITR